MNHIFIDLEFCTCFRKSSPLRCEIIEIGAVKFDDKMNLVSEFDRLVKPCFTDSIPSVERNLTGITWKMVENEASYFDVMNDFFDWVDESKEYKIYSWSTTDSLQMLKESKVKGYPLVQMGLFDKWIDFQSVFMKTLNLKNQISLEHALDYFELFFAGNQHRAHCDAYNTARLYKYLLNIPSVSLDLKPVGSNGGYTLEALENLNRQTKTRNDRNARRARRRIRSFGRDPSNPHNNNSGDKADNLQ